MNGDDALTRHSTSPLVGRSTREARREGASHNAVMRRRMRLTFYARHRAGCRRRAANQRSAHARRRTGARSAQRQPRSRTRRRSVPGFWDPRRRPERPDTSRISPDPLPDRDRLSAVQLRGSGRQSRGLQCRAGAADLRGAEDAVHDPAAPLRHAGGVARRESRRRGDRLPRDHAGDARCASTSPIPIIAPTARFVSLRDERRCPTWARGDSRARRSPWSAAPRTAVSQDLLHRGGGEGFPNMEAAREALRKGEADLLFGDGVALAFWLNGTDRPAAAPSSAARSRKPVFRRRRRHRGPAGQRHAAPGVQLGAVPAVGERPLHRPVAAVFSDQSVLRRFETCKFDAASPRFLFRPLFSHDRRPSIPPSCATRRAVQCLAFRRGPEDRCAAEDASRRTR